MEPVPQFGGRNPPLLDERAGEGLPRTGMGKTLGELCCVLGFKFAAPLLLRWQRGRCGGTGEGLGPPPRGPLLPAVVGSKRSFAAGPRYPRCGEQLLQGGLAQGPGSWKGQDGGFSGAGCEFRRAWGLGFPWL